jgi:single-stranded DNA-binding protein
MDEPTRQRINQLLEEIYRLVNPAPVEPAEAPANITPIKRDEMELEGVIDRTELKVVRAKSLFTAGLKVNQGEAQEWLSIAAWGPTAEPASTITRGQVVRVVGKTKDVDFVDSNGVMRSKREVTASKISPVSHATGVTSVNTA